MKRFLDLVLVAEGSIPIYFESKIKEMDDINTAAFISALKSFAQGNFQTELVSLKLGNLDIRLKESSESTLFFVFGISVNTEITPSESQINILMESLEKTWLNSSMNKEGKFINISNVSKAEFEKCVSSFESLILNTTEQETVYKESNIRDWNLLPNKTQDKLKNILEALIVGDNVTILDNSPNSPLIKNVCMNFRIPESIISSLFTNYNYEINLNGNINNDNNIIFDPRENDLKGKFTKSKYLEKYLHKIIKQKNLQHQSRLIDILVRTVGTVAISIVNLSKNFEIEKGNILNILNNLHFEEVRLILELIKRNEPTILKKIVTLPIHKAWFNSW